MANVITLTRRIKAAQNVSKTTKAMQMIAASKLKKAQDAALSARPYVEKLTNLSQNLIAKANGQYSHPYMTIKNRTEKTLLILIAPDKGLCGALITNLMREFFNFKESKEKAEYITIGKKIEGKIATLVNTVSASFPFGTTTPTFDFVYPVAKLINNNYLSGSVDCVKVLYTRFTSIFTQTPSLVTLLPIQLPPTTENKKEYLFEPSAHEVLSEILTHYLEMSLYQFLLESFVSEQGSRMMAMQNATNNANDIIDILRLEYNKTRQAKITSEILDLIGASTTPTYAYE